MSKTSAHISVLTANRLSDGVVVFLDYEGSWAEGIATAAIARYPQEARALEARGAHDAERNRVVEPYLVEVRETANSLVPIRTRERVRIEGPSILGDVPGYVAPVALVRQAHRGESDREPQLRSRPEPVEGRAPDKAFLARPTRHETIAASPARSPAEAA
jgi:hypothetical protein